MMKLSAFFAPAGFVAAAVMAAGCGSGTLAPLPVANVTGTVTLDGKPMEKGTITFSTDGRPPMVFEIQGGKYNGAAMVGSNLISISLRKPMVFAGGKDPSGGRLKGSGQSGPPGQAPSVPEEETLPKEYNTESKQTRVVEAGGANKFDFDIKSAKK